MCVCSFCSQSILATAICYVDVDNISACGERWLLGEYLLGGLLVCSLSLLLCLSYPWLDLSVDRSVDVSVPLLGLLEVEDRMDFNTMDMGEELLLLLLVLFVMVLLLFEQILEFSTACN